MSHYLILAAKTTPQLLNVSYVDRLLRHRSEIGLVNTGFAVQLDRDVSDPSGAVVSRPPDSELTFQIHRCNRCLAECCGRDVAMDLVCAQERAQRQRCVPLIDDQLLTAWPTEQHGHHQDHPATTTWRRGGARGNIPANVYVLHHWGGLWSGSVMGQRT